MFDVARFLEVAIPAIATGAAGAYLLLQRRELRTLRGRPADLFAAGLLVVAVGAATAAYGIAMEAPDLASAGRMMAALGAIPAVGAVIQVLKTYERERAERERLERLQRATSAQVEAIVRASEATGLGILVAAPLQGSGDRIVSCNAQAAKLIGLPQDAILGRELAEIFVPEDHEPFEKLKAKVMGNPRLAASGAFRLASNNPRTGPLPVDLGLTQETTPSGITFGVALVDARRRRTALAAAQEARSDADFYLDLVTHDLSNFNQGALGYLELLDLDHDAPAERRARFETNALRQIRSSARLIENVKLLSVIRESRDPLGPTDALFALHDAIDHVVSVITEKEVEVRLVPTTPAHNVRADSWLRDLFVHLLDNAVKFTPGKRVEVAVSVAENSDQRSLVFRIADHGRGITPDERAIILDRLASRKRDYSAYRSGIGLFIVKTIADRYGAKLAIEDRVPGEPDQGCVFSLEIPTP